MNASTTKWRRMAATIVAAALLAACGTAPRQPLGMKEYSGNVVYGDNALPPPPPPPPAAEPIPAFPGFIIPPAPRPEAVGIAPAPVRTPTTLRGATQKCPEDDPLATPEAESFGTIPGPPKAATIPYRQTGTRTVGGRTTAVAPEASHAIGGNTNLTPGTFRFNVGVASAGMTTITTYQVDQRGASDALSIVQIRTQDQVGTDGFTPAAPITILPLPPVKGRTFSGTGSDPVHQTAMTIFGKVLGKTRVNACGTPVEAWLVEVGTDPQTGQPSEIVDPTGTTIITGTYAVATQFGGLIVAEDLTLQGSNVRVVQHAATNKVPARP